MSTQPLDEAEIAHLREYVAFRVGIEAVPAEWSDAYMRRVLATIDGLQHENEGFAERVADFNKTLTEASGHLAFAVSLVATMVTDCERRENEGPEHTDWEECLPCFANALTIVVRKAAASLIPSKHSWAGE